MSAYTLLDLCLFSASSRPEALLDLCLFSADFDLDFDLDSPKKQTIRGRAGESRYARGYWGAAHKPPKVYQIDTNTVGTLSRPHTPPRPQCASRISAAYTKLAGCYTADQGSDIR
jgi:hypothetical protein